MEKLPKILLITNLFIILFLAAFIIWQKEYLLKNGTLVFLELQPVDPRSLIQGDFMDLRYKLCQEMDNKDVEKKGVVRLKIDSLNIVERLILPNQDSLSVPLRDLLLKFHISNNMFRLGAESYFFEEGKANVLDSAKYGGLILDRDGNSILTGLFDKNLTKL